MGNKGEYEVPQERIEAMESQFTVEIDAMYI